MEKFNENPLVTVVIPVHNAEAFLKEAIESIINQTYTNLEILLINDGSTDNSSKIIAEYASYDQRIKVITNRNALGYGGEKASNEAYKIASGDFIAKLDADDVAMPDRLEKQIQYLINNPDIFLVGSWMKIIDQAGIEKGKRKYPVNNEDILREFYLRNCIGHPTIMFRNKIIPDDFYKLRFKALNDYYTHFLHMQQGLKMANIPDYLVKYRIHNSNTTFSRLKEQWMVNMEIKRYIDSNISVYFRYKTFIYLIDAFIRYMPNKLMFILLRLRNQFNN